MAPIPISVITQKPIALEITWEDGSSETVTLPKLGVRGLLPWLDELTQERREQGREQIAKARLSGPDRVQAELMVERDEAIISDLIMPIQTPAGVQKVLELSLAQGGYAADQQAKILSVLMNTAHLAYNLAKELSTLFLAPPALPASSQAADSASKGGKNPLPLQPDPEPPSDSASTGSQAA